MHTHTEPISMSKKRLVVHILIIILISLSFWSLSRYPDLLYEAKRAEEGTLLERNLGTITKEELIEAEQSSGGEIQATLTTIGITTLNWLDTNKLGMSFGIVLGGAFLVLLTPLTSIRRYFSMKGLAGSIVGLFVGAPMGICANCVAPVGVAMKKKGVSLETTLSAMFASPTLNIVGLMIAFTVLPLDLVITKIAATLFLIFLVVPIVAKFLAAKHAARSSIPEEEIQFQEETWFQAIQGGIFSFLSQTAKLAALVVPLMIFAGLLGATIITLFPLENFIDPTKNQLFFIGAAAVIGTALPIPMLVDLILVLALLQAGLSAGIAATLLVTLPSYSIFSTLIIGKYFSRKLAVVLFLAVMGTGATAGLIVTAEETIKNALSPRSGPSFVNVIEGSRIKSLIVPLQTRMGGRIGAAWADYDSDGHLDLLIVGEPEENKLYRNNGDGTFTDVIEQAKLFVGLGHISAAVFGDYDNDGCVDLYISRHGSRASLDAPGSPDVLYHNNCNGTFTDVTENAGIKDALHGNGVAWADYDNDGYLDLYVANWGVDLYAEEAYLLDAYTFEPNILYKNNGDGTFTDVTKEAHVTGNAQCDSVENMSENIRQNYLETRVKHSYQPIWFDYNNDGNLDLFVATDTFLSPLYKNNGDGTFTDVTKEAGLCLRGSLMGVTVGDYDNDGDLDLYVTNVGRNYLWQNNGDGTFIEASDKAGVADKNSLGWGAGFLDYDNDGDLDLYGVNGRVRREVVWDPLMGVIRIDKLFQNNGDGTFIEVATKEGIYGNDAKEAASFGDYNNDGFIDMFVVSSYLETKARHRLYQNQGNSNNWLTIQLVGTKSNKDAVGARINVISDGKSQIREIVTGSSFLSQNSLWHTFGLGPSLVVDTIEINWPSGTKQILRNIKVNQKIIIKEE